MKFSTTNKSTIWRIDIPCPSVSLGILRLVYAGGFHIEWNNEYSWAKIEFSFIVYIIAFKFYNWFIKLL